jgi:predicted O-linked N-acetylglucosamine transferase (SPINDLY family)
MNPDIFSIWLEILTSVNNSYLWIPLNNEIFQKNIRSFAQNLGVNPDRIIFADRLDSHEQHLSRYLCADLFLDTFPYGAHTTANDALWANLPVITVAGSTFASRECASILNGVGLNQLITDNLSDYKKLAIRLAHDKKFLGEFKDHLTFNKSSHRLFNNHLTVSNLEKLFNQMVEINLSGKAAHDIFC